MLEEAVAALKAGLDLPEEETWSPTIAIGTPVLIPESYIADLDIRMALYRRCHRSRMTPTSKASPPR